MAPVSAADRAGMELALAEARAALAEHEVPVGAVVIHGGAVVARAHNQPEAVGSPRSRPPGGRRDRRPDA